MLQNRKRSYAPVVVLLVALTAATAALAGQPQIHGVVSQGYLKSTDYNYLIPSEEGSFAFHEAMLNFSTRVTDNIRVGAQLMGRNFGTDGNEDIVLDWAFGDWRLRDEFGLRVGKVKTPHGLYNQTRDVDMVRNAILLPQSVYTEKYRGFMNAFEGVSAYGTLAIGEAASVEYEAYVGTVDFDNNHFLSQDVVNKNFVSAIYGTALPVSYEAAEAKYVGGGALRVNTPLDGLRLGGSVVRSESSGRTEFFGPLGSFGVDSKLKLDDWYVLSAEYTADRFMLAYEFNRVFADFSADGLLVPTGLPDPYPATALIEAGGADRRGGWYGMGTFQATDYLQLGSYYSVYYPDYDQRDSDAFAAYQKDLAFTVRYDVTDFWLLKFEAHLMKGFGDVTAQENLDAAFDTEDWTLFGVKSTFYF